MKIQIYGSGCDKCKKLYANAEAAVKSAGIDAELEKVTDMDAIVAAGVMMTPALAVDGKIVSSGKVLSSTEITEFLGGAPECSCDGATGSEPPCCCFAGSSPAKRIIALLLLLFVMASIGIMVYREIKAGPPASAAAGAEAVSSPIKDKVLTVYYFHGDRRCMTCNKIEEITRKAVEDKFAPELADGTVVFRSVNVDEPGNKHFVQDFGLDSKIVVMQKGDRIEKFPEVWTLVKNPEQLTAYIQNGVEQMK
ncbi:MAG: nitrophenyl compound nitroreductase subunit ArsF family protein [Victivallaceae bacterium]